MANFTNIQITNRGRALQAKAQAGAQLVFTRFRIGSGQMSSQQIADMTNLIQPVMWLTLNKSQPSSTGRHTIGAPFTNTGVTTGFYFREWGLFAQDPDVGEILYCYGNVGAGAEYIPAGGGSEIIEQQLDMIVIISNAATVSAVIDESLAFVSLAEYRTKIDQDVRTTARPTFLDVTAGQFRSTAAAGTAPMVVASTTLVENLNADRLDGYHADTAVSPGTIAVRASDAGLRASHYTSTTGNGNAPFIVTSSTLVANLNADLLDGEHAAVFARLASPALTGNPTAPTQAAGNSSTRLATTAFVTTAIGNIPLPDTSHLAPKDSPSFTGDTFFSGPVTFTGQWRSVLAQGTAPFVVGSTTLVANLNADMLDGAHASQSNAANTIPVRDASGRILLTAATFAMAQGTAPFAVTSTTLVNNLNADMVDGFHASAASSPNTIVVQDGNGIINAARLNLSAASGSSPLVVNSSTVVTNLNADLLDGIHASQMMQALQIPPTADLNTIVAPGTHRMQNLAAGLNFPPGSAYGNMLVMRRPGSDTIAQLVFPYSSDDPYFRVGSPAEVGGNGAWRDWARIWNDKNHGPGSGLNADQLHGQQPSQGDTPRSIAQRTLTGDLGAARFVSTATTGAPLSVSSTTLVTSLNADMVDGYHLNQDLRTTAGPQFAGLRVNGEFIVSGGNAFLDRLMVNAAIDADRIYANGEMSADHIILTRSTGSSPMIVSNTTKVDNLNADLLDGYHAGTSNTANTIVVQDSNRDIAVRRVTANAPQGTSPFAVSSTTVVGSLNADLLDGFHASATSAANSVVVQDANQDITVRRLISNMANGTAPLVVTSTTVVPNLNADMVDGRHADMDITPFTLAVRDPDGSVGGYHLIALAPQGKPPLYVSSTTVITNLNADMLDGMHLHELATPYAVTTGSGMAYVASFTPSFSKVAGRSVRIRAHVASTNGASPTLNANGTGASPLRYPDGTAVKLSAGGIYTFVWDSVTSAFIFQGEGGDRAKNVRYALTFDGDSGPDPFGSFIAELSPNTLFTIHYMYFVNNAQSFGYFVGRKTGATGSPGFTSLGRGVSSGSFIYSINADASTSTNGALGSGVLFIDRLP
ncbi:phage tail protein [Paenibacillus daejeonensis]|uniref:phage tail-collar fiber domain-containing protein n=1 Tax=Paenibacillus daejeonensis TaxID=135193 RepID=UPI000372FACC|nr:phage tail protein [Paenibacillus daejeonensis]